MEENTYLVLLDGFWNIVGVRPSSHPNYFWCAGNVMFLKTKDRNWGNDLSINEKIKYMVNALNA